MSNLNYVTMQNLVFWTRIDIMKLLFDFFPIVLFFIFYKIWGIYIATGIAMVASLLQVIMHRLHYQKYEKLHLVSLVLILILGGATLFFHNVWFIKWKPTGIYWLSSLVFLYTSCFSEITLIQKMMGNNVQLPALIWKRLNMAWATYFFCMGSINVYVAYYYDTDVWVNFKLFGGVGCMLVFVFLQALYLTKHAITPTSSEEKN